MLYRMIYICSEFKCERRLRTLLRHGKLVSAAMSKENTGKCAFYDVTIIPVKVKSGYYLYIHDLWLFRVDNYSTEFLFSKTIFNRYKQGKIIMIEYVFQLILETTSRCDVRIVSLRPILPLTIFW